MDSFHVLVVGPWLAAWASGTGVPIGSSVECRGREVRVRRYVVGPTVLKIPLSDARRNRACSLIVQLALASSRPVPALRGNVASTTQETGS